MILQSRAHGVRVIEQHAHALYSGELAHLWCGPARDEGPLSMACVMGIALHDYAWLPLDALATIAARDLPFDDARGLPHDFMTLPTATKIALYSQGLDTLEGIEPYVALLISLHYTAFFGRDSAAGLAFRDAERDRRARLAAELGLDDDGGAAATRDLAILRFLDLVSLYACVAPPDAHVDTLPFWLKPEMRCLETDYMLRFLDEGTATLDPFPLREAWTARIAYRDLDGERFDDADAFLASWRAAEPRVWILTLKAA